MSTTRKILIAIFSIILIGALAFLITWGVINFNKVKDLMSGTGIYNKDDIQNAYEDGYNTALSNKEEYEELINGYKDTIVTLTDNVSQLTSEKNVLANSNRDFEGQIRLLTNQKDRLQSEVNTLNTVKENNEKTIADMDVEIASLEKQVSDLEYDKTVNEQTIQQLNKQIENLQALNAQMQSTNELNVQTISMLNAQISSLNAHILELNSQVQTNSTTIVQLNSRITELQNSITVYEQTIANLVAENNVVVTFEFAGSVYTVQVVEKGNTVTVSDPTSTEYLVFNGWTYNNEPINLAEFVVNENVKIVADVTYKYAVNFTVDGETKSTQIVEQGQFASEPAKPKKNGYTFEYWTLDGETQVFFDQLPISANTTFIAKFTPLYDVSFVYEEETLATRRVKENATTTPYSVTDTDYKVFNGWKVNGVIVDVAKYKITGNTVFVADITYKYDVIFKMDDSVYDSQILASNSKISLPTAPTKSGYEFDYWTIDGETEFNFDTFVVTENITFVAKFTQLFTVRFASDIGTFNPTIAVVKEVRAGEIIGNIDYVPTKDLYEFKCWAKSNGLSSTEVDLDTLVINENMLLVPVFTKVASVISVYDGETCIYSSIHNIGEEVTLRIQPLGRTGYRFVGYFNSDYWSYKDSKVDYVPYYPTIKVGSSNTVLNAYYAFNCFGTFTADDGSKFVFGYQQEPSIYGGSASVDISVNLSSSNAVCSHSGMLNEDNYDFKNGTFTFVYSSSVKYIGTYNLETDTWTFVSQTNYNGKLYESSCVFSRTAYTQGTFDEELLK